MTPIVLILIIVLVIAVIYGGTSGRQYGMVGWSPVGVILLVLLVLLLTGYIHL